MQCLTCHIQSVTAVMSLTCLFCDPIICDGQHGPSMAGHTPFALPDGWMAIASLALGRYDIHQMVSSHRPLSLG